MKKCNFLNELTNHKLDSNSKIHLAYRQQYDIKPNTHLLYVSPKARQFGPLNDHMTTDPCWAVTMVTSRAQHWHLAVTCNVIVAIVKTIVIVTYGLFAISDHMKLILRLCYIHEWWRWYRLHTLARFGRNFAPRDFFYRSHRRGGHGTNFLTVLTYRSPLL